MISQMLGGVMMAYLAAGLLFLTAALWSSPRLKGFALGLLGGALAAHTLAFGARWVASYTQAAAATPPVDVWAWLQLVIHQVPLSNFYESLVFFSWSLAFLALVYLHRYAEGYLGLVGCILASLALAYASLGADSQIRPLMPALKSNWLLIHVITCFIGYAAFGLCYAVATIYLWQARKKWLPTPTLSNWGYAGYIFYWFFIVQIIMPLLIYLFLFICYTIYYYVAFNILKITPPVYAIIIYAILAFTIYLLIWFSIIRKYSTGIFYLFWPSKRNLSPIIKLSFDNFFTHSLSWYFMVCLIIPSISIFIAAPFAGFFGFLSGILYGAFQSMNLLILSAIVSGILTSIALIYFWIIFLQKGTLLKLEFMDRFIYQTATVGFIFLTLGILTGAVWAETAWGHYWSWDPKETASLITWFIYAALLHARLVRGWQGRPIAWLAVLGFAAVIFTYLGVSFLLGGLHSYAT